MYWFLYFEDKPRKINLDRRSNEMWNWTGYNNFSKDIGEDDDFSCRRGWMFFFKPATATVWRAF